MVECAFGILCNKWSTFHRAIDIRQDLCHVTVETCCILHNFVRETAFSFNIHYTNVPSILEATEMLLITTGCSCFSVSARTGN